MTDLINLFNYNDAYSDVIKLSKAENEWHINQYIIDQALSFLNLLRINKLPVPRVFGTFNHSIQFEWHYNNKDYLALEMFINRLSLFRSTEKYYCFNKETEDYDNIDKILEQIQRWHNGSPFLRRDCI